MMKWNGSILMKIVWSSFLMIIVIALRKIGKGFFSVLYVRFFLGGLCYLFSIW